MSEELFYQNQLQNLEEIKSTYFSQLDEVERKRAEIALKKEQIKVDESLLIEDSKKIREAKKLIANEYEKLVARNDELKLAKKEYSQKKEFFSQKALELESCLKKYELDQESIQKRKSENYRILRSIYEEELSVNKRQKRLEITKTRLDRKAREIAAQKDEIASHEMDIDIDNEKIERRREYVKHLNETLTVREKEVEVRQNELSELVRKTEEDIGKHVTIQRQHLNMMTKDSRIEQQLTYIKSLEENILELTSKLESKSEELRQVKIYSTLVEQNLELIRREV
ncbi:hypothetical protein RE476_02900 [Methanolobus mangrovi]|uniref:Uncharacterized protein n=1 Tax=Methanolobus mangrovi TaxID=3072977 RepID=A0AA51YJN7_9EURY|nr:hypothetical protein [Methanolobus mangrovi]WMW22788.1 hypothetical protein RE476_02900 [Methanolobus mangrovi]